MFIMFVDANVFNNFTGSKDILRGTFVLVSTGGSVYRFAVWFPCLT